VAGGTLDADYLCLTSVAVPEALGLGTQSLGANVIVADPLFADDTFTGWETVVAFPTLVKSGVPFTVETPMLETETTYYVRTYATNAFGAAWSSITNFTTGSVLPDGWGIGGGADVIHVRTGAVGANDGSDWYNAFTSLGAALATLGGTLLLVR